MEDEHDCGGIPECCGDSITEDLEKALLRMEERIYELEDVLFELFAAWDGYDPKNNSLDSRINRLLCSMCSRATLPARDSQ